MTEANGIDLDRAHGAREAMVELIKIVEGFYACGIASSVYCATDAAGNAVPEPVFANIGKLLLSTQIYDMHRLAHHVSGGLVVTLLEGGLEVHQRAAEALDVGRAQVAGLHAAQRAALRGLVRCRAGGRNEDRRLIRSRLCGAA